MCVGGDGPRRVHRQGWQRRVACRHLAASFGASPSICLSLCGVVRCVGDVAGDGSPRAAEATTAQGRVWRVEAWGPASLREGDAGECQYVYVTIRVTMSVAIVAPYDPHTVFVYGETSCGSPSGVACFITRARVCEHGTGDRGRDSACRGRHLHHLCRCRGSSAVQVSVPTSGWCHRHCFPAYLLPGRAGGRSSLASWPLWGVSGAGG